MASIKLDLVNYTDENGDIDPDILIGWIEFLDVTFDEDEVKDGAPWTLEFTGPRADLITLIGRYEDDAELCPELIAEIVGE